MLQRGQADLGGPSFQALVQGHTHLGASASRDSMMWERGLVVNPMDALTLLVPLAEIRWEFGGDTEAATHSYGAVATDGSLQHGQFDAVRKGGWSAVMVPKAGVFERACHGTLTFPDPSILLAEI